MIGGKHIMKKINVTPNWENLFEVCTSQVKAVVKKEHARDLIVEMLQFGKRLYLERLNESNLIPKHSKIKEKNHD